MDEFNGMAEFNSKEVLKQIHIDFEFTALLLLEAGIEYEKAVERFFYEKVECRTFFGLLKGKRTRNEIWQKRNATWMTCPELSWLTAEKKIKVLQSEGVLRLFPEGSQDAEQMIKSREWMNRGYKHLRALFSNNPNAVYLTPKQIKLLDDVRWYAEIWRQKLEQ